MPNEDEAFIKFNGSEKTIKAPFFLSLDTEAILFKDGHPGIIQRHVLSSYAITLVRPSDGSLIHLYKGFGADSAKRLVEDIQSPIDYCNTNKPMCAMDMSVADDFDFETVTRC